MTDETNDQQEKKIIIDEDWKTRVQAEKEAAKQQEQEPADDGQPTPQESAPQESSPKEPDSEEPPPQESPEEEPAPQQEVPLPPPSLAYLATSLATQAMMSLGMASDPDSKKSEVRPQEAKHLIDMIAMLEEKTKGNQTPEETAMFDSFLHELRMAYVTVSHQGGA